MGPELKEAEKVEFITTPPIDEGPGLEVTIEEGGDPQATIVSAVAADEGLRASQVVAEPIEKASSLESHEAVGRPSRAEKPEPEVTARPPEVTARPPEVTARPPEVTAKIPEPVIVSETSARRPPRPVEASSEGRAGLPHPPQRPEPAPVDRSQLRIPVPEVPSARLAHLEGREERAQAVIHACNTALARLDPKTKPELLGRLHYEMGLKYEHPLGNLVRAAESFQQALAVRPEHAPSLRGGRRVAFRQNNAAQALPLFDAEFRVTADAQIRAELLVEKAECLESLGRDADVEKVLAQAGDLRPADVLIQSELVLWERKHKNLLAADKSLGCLADAIADDPRHRAVLLAARGRIAEVARRDPKLAIEYYRAALALDQRAAGVITALERLTYSEGRFNELTEILALHANQVVRPELRAIIYQELARIGLDRLHRVDEGIVALERAAADQPEDTSILTDLALAYEKAHRAEDQARVLERLLTLSTEPRARAGVAYRIGQLYDLELSDPTRAAAFYLEELRRDPSHAQTLAALAALYEKHGEWAAWVDMMTRDAESCQEGLRRAAAFSRIASVVEVRLKNPKAAILLHERALAAFPDYRPSFLALERLLSVLGRYADLVTLYEQAVEGERDNEAKAALLFKIGRLAEDALGDPRAAVQAYDRVHGLYNPQIEALHAVQRAAERGGLTPKLVQALEQEAQATRDAVRRVALMHRAAEVLAESGDTDGAVARWRKVLELDQKFEPALLGLSRLLAQSGRWEEWLGVEKRRLAALGAIGTARADVLYGMAVAQEEKLGRRADAIATLREVLTANPEHLLAQSALSRLLFLEERFSELVEVLERSAGSGVDPSVVARRLTRAGELLEHRLNKPEAALAAYEKALAAQPASRLAADGRVRLLAHSQKSAALADALAQNAERDAALPEGLVALFAEAEVRRDELGQTDRALQLFEKLVAREPTHLAGLVALEELAFATGATELQVRTLSALVGVLRDPAARVAALFRLGRVLGRAGQAEQELSVLGKLLEIDPAHRLTLQRLERLALAQSKPPLLAQIDARLLPLLAEPRLAAIHQTRLAEALEDAGDPAALVGYAASVRLDPEDVAAVRGMGRLAFAAEAVAELEAAADAELPTTADLEVFATLLLRGTELLERAGNLPEAFRLLKKALSVHPDHLGCAERLIALRMTHGEVGLLVQELGQVATAARSPERAADLFSRAARLLSDVEHDLPGAIAMLTRVTNALPKNATVWFELGELLVRDGQSAAAVERFRKVLELEAPRDRALLARLALGRLLVELGEHKQALPHLEAVLAQRPHELEALRALLAVRLAQNEIDAAAELAASMVEGAQTAPERSEALLGLARVERRRGQMAAAERAYEQAVALGGVEGGAARELVELLRAHGQAEPAQIWSGYAGALQKFVDAQAAPPSALGRAAAELARVLDQELQQAALAIPLLERALGVNPEEPELLRALGAARQRAGQWGPSIDAFRRLLARDAGCAEAYRGIALALERLDRRKDAVVAWAPLVLLGDTTDLEVTSVAGRLPRTGPIPPKSLDHEVFSWFGGPPATDAMGALLAAMSDGLSRVQDTELDRYGLSARDRLGSRSSHPLRVLSDRLAEALDAQDFDLFVTNQGTARVVMECGDPPAIIVPATLLTLPEPVQMFALARVITPFALKWGGVEMLDLRSLQLWVRAAFRIGDPSYGADGPEDEVITVLAGRLTRALSSFFGWGGKGKVEAAAQQCLAMGRLDVADFRARVRVASARMAAVLADDLLPVVRYLQQTDADPSLAAPAAAAAVSSLVEEMLRGWVSEGAYALRRRLSIG